MKLLRKLAKKIYFYFIFITDHRVKNSFECVLIYYECLKIVLKALWRTGIPPRGGRRRFEQKST